MKIIYTIILILYSLVLLYILLYNMIQLELLFTYRRRRAAQKNLCPKGPEQPFTPMVTIQLPMYNEKYVAERLIDNICRIDYPKDRMEIQILDDSNDETLDISRRKVKEYQEKGFDIQLIRRPERIGYKAGALQYGLERASGEFIAIFDADFLPQKDFLRKTLPCFREKNTGVVQTRWEHLNQDHSLITRIQALQLNVHFSIEQNARYQADYLLQFNGTAGVWRKKTILDAGGWQADTLTEDLDLSYRAQLRGWKILYREDIGSPAELPAEIFSYKSQQFRWMKGGAETARKLIPVVWRSDMPFWKKVHATAHLTASTVFVLIFTMAFLSVPMIWAIPALDFNIGYFIVFAIGIIAIAFSFYQANVQNKYVQHGQSRLRKVIKFTLIFPAFMALSMGLSLHNTLAVIQGLRGKKSPFVRTPKFNLQSADTMPNKYILPRLDGGTLWEGLMCLYFIFGIMAGIWMEHYSMLILHVFLAAGFGAIFWYSLRSLRIQQYE